MTNRTAERSLGGRILKWIARIVALIVVAFILLFAFGVGLTPEPGVKLRTSDYFMFAAWGIFIIGLLLGLKWEMLGGLISIVAIVLFLLLLTLTGRSFGRYSWIWAIFWAPGILYLLSWYVSRRAGRPSIG